MKKYFIYEYVPLDKGAFRSFYVLSATDGDKREIQRVGNSVKNLAEKLADAPINDDDIGEVMITTIAAPQVAFEKGFRLLPVSEVDLGRFRNFYFARQRAKKQ